MDRTEVTVEALAAEACSWFEFATRSDGESYDRLKDGRPDWVQELVFDAHGDFMPDDWRYSCIRSALEFISEGGDDEGEFADAEVDVYTGARLQWLSSSLLRLSYCDQAADEYGLDSASESTDLADRIGMGQYVEACEVFGLVMKSLESRELDLAS